MRRLLPLCVCLLALPALARVISYAPYSDRSAMPAVQSRVNRHFALVELVDGYNSTLGQLILYDSKGEEEPRVVYPIGGGTAVIRAAALREDDAQLVIFVQTDSGAALSVDRGVTWKTFGLYANALMSPFLEVTDAGGPFARGRYSQLRIGTRDYPFLVANNSTLYAVKNDGTLRPLAYSTSSDPLSITGTSRDGSQVLVRIGNAIGSVSQSGAGKFLGNVPVTAGKFEGWITPDGNAYVQNRVGDSDMALYYLSDGVTKFVGGTIDHTRQTTFPPPTLPQTSSSTFFAVPSADYAGAWMLTRSPIGTTLAYHSPSEGTHTYWEDRSKPEVEALHPGQSGNTVLVQVHRPRPSTDSATFKDPALAVWHKGDPPPRYYDELFLEETSGKGFVHVDPDAIESGDPFVFDSGLEIPPPPPTSIISPAPPSAGGGDVLQEWGVVRASLAQRLVLPGAAHTPGAYSSFWMTDVTFYNPDIEPVNVSVRFAPNGSGIDVAPANLEKTITLAPREIRLVSDILQSLFNLDSGNGAIYITPDVGAAINVSSRTYTKSPAGGTYGFGMNAIDVFAAAGPRFPVTFSGAFLGSDYRTNLVLTDVSGRSSEASVSAWGTAANGASAKVAAPVMGQQQVTFLDSTIGITPNQNAAVVVQPTRGEAIATLFAIDNRTNDATYFPPDLPASLVRTIPAIGHLDGAHGSQFRTDVYIFNNSTASKTVVLQPRTWDGASSTSILITVKGHELRVLPDILYNMFHMTGIARLQLWSYGSAMDPSIRVTSRTYTVDANGGTYGFLMPPLNSFQNATAGDTLEILGTRLQKDFRTNIGLVDLNLWTGGRRATVRIDIVNDLGAVIDSNMVSIPAAGGTQLNDYFHERHFADSRKPVLIRITVLNGAVGAYAAVIDDVTNDPAYFAANLGAKQ